MEARAHAPVRAVSGPCAAVCRASVLERESSSASRTGRSPARHATATPRSEAVWSEARASAHPIQPLPLILPERTKPY
eukprot:6181444-Pleurochrysis_carterae.AAC.1